jgi:RNA polymerase sigma factor (sigma-70 family)
MLLEILAKKHKDWVRMVISFGCDPDIAEDFVQEMYLRLHNYNVSIEKITYKGEVNTLFIYRTLLRMYLLYKTAKQKVEYVDLSTIEDHVGDTDPSGREDAYIALITSVEVEMNTWHWYDKKLLRLYAESGMSLQTIAQETKISKWSIYQTIKHGKHKLKSKHQKDYDTWKEAQGEGAG